MILNISVTECRRELTHLQIGMTRDRLTVPTLRRDYAPKWFENPREWRWEVDTEAGMGLQMYVNKYSEVATSEPWKDIELYFKRDDVANGESSGALLYPSKRPTLNTAAMASASEALAGWFCEYRYGWSFVDRPRTVSPDIVFQDSANDRIALVEVKSSSLRRNIAGRMTTDMIDLLRILAFTKYLKPSRYCAALIMVQLVGVSDINLTSLVLEE